MLFCFFWQDNDIALIRINERVTKIKPIALPSDRTETYTDKTATVIGWGKIYSGKCRQFLLG